MCSGWLKETELLNYGVIKGTGLKDELFISSMKFNTSEMRGKHWRIFHEFRVVPSSRSAQLSN